MKKILLLAGILTLGWEFSATAQVTPATGDIVITEIMSNPSAVSDTKGEWLELYNVLDLPLDLNGLIIRDEGSNHHQIDQEGGLILEPHCCLVLGKNGDPSENGGLSVGYVYGNFSLSNSSDEVILELPDGTLLDQVNYESGWPLVSGASMELHPDYLSPLANDLPDNWLEATLSYGSGDKGTPGTLPVTSSLPEDWIPFSADLYPNPTKGKVHLDIQFPGHESGYLILRNVLGQTIHVVSFDASQRIEQVFDLNAIPGGLYFLGMITSKRKVFKRVLKIDGN